MPLKLPRAGARRAVPLAVFILLALGADVARAVIVTIPAGRDNTLYETSAGNVSNGAGPSFFAGRTNEFSNSIRRGLLWFDVAGAVPSGSTILGAALRLSLSATGGGADPVSLHRATASWGEGTSNAGASGGTGAPATAGDATWLHRFFATTSWTSPGGDFVAAPSATILVAAPGDYTWGSNAALVAEVQAWLDVPAGNFGWLVRGDESAQPTSKRFESRQSPTPALRPLLTIEYTQAVPATPATWGRVKGHYR